MDLHESSSDSSDSSSHGTSRLSSSDDADSLGSLGVLIDVDVDTESSPQLHLLDENAEIGYEFPDID